MELTNYGSKMTCLFYDAGSELSHGSHTYVLMYFVEVSTNKTHVNLMFNL